MNDVEATATEVDVAIVGFGPVGQVLTALLGRAGHTVGCFERHGQCYTLPRAIRLDGEAMRLFTRLGIRDEIDAEVMPVSAYEWFGADGELIVHMDMSAPQPSGFEHSYLFYQPVTEAALSRAAASAPSAVIERGWVVETLVQHDDYVELTMRQADPIGNAVPGGPTHQVRARYVIGADGANSIVREQSNISRHDQGFAEYWLVVDVRPYDITALDHLPKAAQFCDPRRPSAVMANGRTYRRWEFMLLPDERPEDFIKAERAWELLAPFIAPTDGELIRHAVYQFRSLTADTMRAGRVLLAGDSAHLMPPFMGEGMNSGLRDAVNLAWKLDLVLRGVAPDQILDSYTTERIPQNEAAIAMSIQMGQVSCVLDVAQAAERDAALRAQAFRPPPPLPGMLAGIVDERTDDTISGDYAVNGRFSDGEVQGWADDVLGTGFSIVTTRQHPADILDPEQLDFLSQVGCSYGSLDSDHPGHLQDVDGRFSAWLAENGMQAVIVRPDGYTFGGVADVADLPELVDELRDRITGRAMQPARL